jgi:hypothetical protein
LKGQDTISLMKTSRKKVCVWLFLAVAASLMVQCTLVPSNGFGIAVYSKSITLGWNPPWNVLAANFANVAGYNVYCRPHFNGSWTRIATVPASSPPEVVITHDMVGDGAWDFAVSMVSAIGQESAYHTSLDDTANPTGGWYIIWKNSSTD